MKAELLSNPSLYHYLRQIMTGGMPFRRWVDLYGLTDPAQRIADIGSGPSDILRYLDARSKPEFYLGIDISEPYLRTGEARARRLGLDAGFVRMDLDALPSDADVKAELAATLEAHKITRVLLLGVLHHIGDESARAILDLTRGVSTIDSVMTSDVVYLPQRRLNNLLCDWDRGAFVRDEPAYDALVQTSGWATVEKTFTWPGLSFIRYIHYSFSKPARHD